MCTFLTIELAKLFLKTNIHVQQKLREEREHRRSLLDYRHYYIIETIAETVGVDKSEVEDNILESRKTVSISHFLFTLPIFHFLSFKIDIWIGECKG